MLRRPEIRKLLLVVLLLLLSMSPPTAGSDRLVHGTIRPDIDALKLDIDRSFWSGTAVTARLAGIPVLLMASTSPRLAVCCCPGLPSLDAAIMASM
jgi:hypothetical protein